MNIAILSIDMDGTCLDSRHRISDKTMNSLLKAKEAGIEIVPTTGRALSCLPLGLRNRDLYRYVISSNGAVINDIKENKVIYSKPIDKLIAKYGKGCVSGGVGNWKMPGPKCRYLNPY